jgi:putative alpha-1,2-mannosidase
MDTDSAEVIRLRSVRTMIVRIDSARILVMVGIIVLTLLALTDAVDFPEDFVNPLAGSFTEGNKFSTGNTLPLVGYPWGFNHWAPMTKHDGGAGSWWFLGNDHTFTWMRCTHQPSPWIGDWGWFLFSPQMSGAEVRNPEQYWEPRGATIKPHIFDAVVAPHNIRMELAPSMHGAIFRVTFPQSDHGEKRICFTKARWTGQGSRPMQWLAGKVTQINTDKVPVPNFAMYMRAESPEAERIDDHTEVKCFIYNHQSSTVTVRMATSLISDEQVLVNLNREIPASASFETVAAEARAVWHNLLKRVDVVDAGVVSEYSARSLTVFYTGLYRGLSFPRRLDEVDAMGKVRDTCDVNVDRYIHMYSRS